MALAWETLGNLAGRLAVSVEAMDAFVAAEIDQLEDVQRQLTEGAEDAARPRYPAPNDPVVASVRSRFATLRRDGE